MQRVECIIVVQEFYLRESNQFVKGKGFFVCDVRVAANGLSCEAARENFSAGFSKTVH